jgi:hypothetical protein
MFELCLEQLADITGGLLRLGTMPPLAGGLEPVRRIVIAPDEAAVGDIFWLINESESNGIAEVQRAFLQGAAGAVTEHPGVEPWAGKFIIQVTNSPLALARVIRCLGTEAAAKSELFGGTASKGLHAVRHHKHLSRNEILRAFRHSARRMPA